MEFSTLFENLKGKIPPIFLRLLIFSYRKQSCLVKWNSTKSREFSIRNGVRQGAVASPIFFSNYLDDIFRILKDSGYGCWIGPHFYGIEGYADDLALLSPDRAGLQEMLNLCKEYFDKLKITISTNVDPKKSKTKYMALESNPN